MKLKIFLSLLLLVFLSACTKGFEEMNKNPNDPTIVEADFLFTTSEFETLNLFGGDMNRVVFFNYTHHFSGFQGEFQRYTVSNSSNNQYWRNTYIRALQPVHQIIELYEENPAYKNRVNIAKIWKAFVISNALSIWGGIPNGDTLNGAMNVPYEREQDLYVRLLNNLKTYANSFNMSGDKFSTKADRIYAGDLLKWKKFANTLRLRLAMRISNDAPNGDAILAKQVVQEIMADESATITSQSETASMKWGTVRETWNPLYDRAVYNYSANIATIPVINESLIYHMLPYNDPRLGIYAKPVTQGPYIGQYFGQNIAYGGGGAYASGSTNPHTGLKQPDYSQIGDVFSKADAEYIFLSLAESEFLKAEAALKGFWGTPTNASQKYYAGIDASFNKYGLTTAQATAYKNTRGIKWGSASDTLGRGDQFMDWLHIASSIIEPNDYFRQIVMQHWLAIPFQGVDAWALIRRTQILEFQPQFATYDGDYKYIPYRIPYPIDEYQTNPAEVKKAVSWLGGPDDLFTKLWFSLPIKKNPYLPY